MKKLPTIIKRSFYTAFLAGLAAVTLSSCKPTYNPPVESPDTETMSADTPYDIDFIQINNDVIENYSETDRAKIFPFIKNLEVDGSNDPKSVTLTLDIADNVSDDAIDILVTDATKMIGYEAYMQDFRLTPSDSESFGSFYDLYDYTLKVTQGGDTIYDQTFETSDGEGLPFDPSVDADTIKESLEAEQEAQSTTAAAETKAAQ